MTEFNRRFGIGAQLKAEHPGYRAAWTAEGKIFDCIKTGRVFNLVTKERYNFKPTYDSVRGALELMRDMCRAEGIGKIAMPKIASGLDRLEWNRIAAIIREVFAHTGIEVMICIPE